MMKPHCAFGNVIELREEDYNMLLDYICELRDMKKREYEKVENLIAEMDEYYKTHFEVK